MVISEHSLAWSAASAGAAEREGRTATGSDWPGNGGATSSPAVVCRDAVDDLGRTLVLVPHPDDETLGCGGVLALLGRAGAAVRVVLFTGGAGSHRQSREYPAARLRALRRREMTAALRELGHGAHCLVTLDLPDGGAPTADDPDFARVVSKLIHITRRFRPDTVLMPSRDDARADHRATCEAGILACVIAAPEARRLEYPVWGADAGSLVVWHVDIGTVVDDKQRALARHRSQLGENVRHDPDGFTLPPELLARSLRSVETCFVAHEGHLHVRP